ncbi:MAG: response regulator [Anaerolineae bacterium]
MTDNSLTMASSPSKEVPAEFVKLVRDALAHLYDTPHLQRHGLLQYLVPIDLGEPKARAQYLREALMKAIADLRPPDGGSPRSPAFRPYAIMSYRFCDGLSNEEIQEQLAIGRRQFFREQQRAIETVSSYLWERRIRSATEDEPGQALDDELAQLGIQSETLDLESELRQALTAVSTLTTARAVAWNVESHHQPQAFADLAITRQLLITVLSVLTEAYSHCYLTISLSCEGRFTVISFQGMKRSLSISELEALLLTPLRLATRLGGGLEVAEAMDEVRVLLRLPSARQTIVAIVDDNPKTLHLFKRYLEPYRYHPLLISEGSRALAEITELQPDVVVLDIMMRDVDGWHILQALRTNPRTRHIPVIICSVLDNEQLARSIGADGYLRKPVSQSELVWALAHARQGSGGEQEVPAAPSPARR